MAWTQGRLLVANPDLEDPNFRRTVIVMLTHDVEGALGLVINRPTDIPVAEGLPEWAAVATAPACVYLGGPVQPEAAIGLGRGPSTSDDLVVGLVAPVDLDGPAEHHHDVRIFIGYSGWSAGQLEREIARGDWFVVDALPTDLATARPETLWRDVLRRQRGRLAIFATASEDPSRN